VDFASDLKKQAYPKENIKSAVLLQRFLIGLQPQINCQILLRKKPATFEEAIAEAVEVEEALSYSHEEISKRTPPSTVNAVSGGPEAKLSQDPTSLKLQDTLDDISKHLEQLETKVQESKRQTSAVEGYRQQRGPRPSNRRCYLCGEEGHFKRECPLNYPRPAGGVGGWPKNH
jgi:hypothetical protein